MQVLWSMEATRSFSAAAKLHSRRRSPSPAVRAPPKGLYHFRNGPRQGTRTGTPGKGTKPHARGRYGKSGQDKPNPELKETDTYTTRATNQDVSDKQSMIASPALISCSACGIAFGPPFIWILKLNSL